MKVKQIVFTKINTAEILDHFVPDPDEGEVQVKLAFSAISSGTERANITGDPNVNSKTEANVAFPRYGGYSSSGVVTAVGENVSDIAVGDRVGLSWSHHTQLLNISAKNVYKLNDKISFEQAALIHIATFPLAAIRKCKLEVGESAIVMGMGILGLFAVSLLKICGAVPIIAVDPDASKREKAIEAGADYALDPFSDDFEKTVKEITGDGVKVAIEVTGNGGALNGVLDCMARFGRVALLGCTRNSDFTIDWYRKVHGPGISLIGAHTGARPQVESYNGWWTSKDDYEALIKLISMGRLDLFKLIDEIHSPEEAPEVYQRLCFDKTFPLVEFDWSKMQ